MAKGIAMRVVRFLIWLLLAWPLTAHADNGRVALVIGAGAYKEVPTLANPPRDAVAIAAALRELGFDTDLVVDPSDRATVERAVRALGVKARAADAAVFFYAGHALEFGGRNYIVPVGAEIHTPQDLPFELVDMELVTSQLDGRARVIMLFLDACRDNPFALRIAGATRSLASRGLSLPTSTATGTLIAYATAPGQTAADGIGSTHSPFTTALLENIKIPGLEVRQLLARVRKSVREASNGRQIPWESSALEGEFYFAPLVSPPPVVRPQARPEEKHPAAVASLPAPTQTSPTELARALALDVPCSVMTVLASGEAITISGQALAGKEFESLLYQIGSVVRVTDAVVKLDRAHCQAVDLMAAYVRQNRYHGAKVNIRPEQQQLPAGRRVGLTVSAPADRALYVDIYTNDGMVQHLLRRPSPGRQTEIIEWTAAAPYGRRLLVALAPHAALDIAARPATENASAYLEALNHALRNRLDSSDAAMPFAEVAILDVTVAEPKPAVAKPVAATPPPKKNLTSTRCANIMERAQMGEPLSDGDRTALRTDCRF